MLSMLMLQTHFTSSKSNMLTHIFTKKTGLNGPTAHQPITAAQNTTSNTLSRIPNTVTDQFNATRNLGEDIGPWITTILTVFCPVTSANGTIPLANVLQQPEAQLTCLKPIDEAGAVDAFIAMVDDTASRGSKMRGGGGGGGIGLLVPRLVMLFWFVGL